MFAKLQKETQLMGGGGGKQEMGDAEGVHCCFILPRRCCKEWQGIVHGRGHYCDRALLGRKMELNTHSVIPDLSFNPPFTWGLPGADVSPLLSQVVIDWSPSFQNNGLQFFHCCD